MVWQFVKVDQNVNKPLARALRYTITKSFFLAIDWTYLYDLSHTCLRDCNYYEVKLHIKSDLFSADNDQTTRLSISYYIYNHKNFILKYLDNALKDFT